MAEFEIDGVTYSASKMDADTQFKVLKRLLPLIANYDVLREALPLAVKGFLGGESIPDGEVPQTKGDVLNTLAKCLGGLALSLASLKDEDLDYIRAACLGLVKKQDGAAWAPIWNKGSRAVQYQDINALTQMRIIAQIVLTEFQSFFPSGALSSFVARQA